MKKLADRALAAVRRYISSAVSHEAGEPFDLTEVGVSEPFLAEQGIEVGIEIAKRAEPNSLALDFHDLSLQRGNPVASTIIQDPSLAGPVLVDTYVQGMPEVRQPKGTRLLYDLVPDLKPGEKAEDYIDRREMVPFRRKYKHIDADYCPCDDCKVTSPVMITR